MLHSHVNSSSRVPPYLQPTSQSGPNGLDFDRPAALPSNPRPSTATTRDPSVTRGRPQVAHAASYNTAQSHTQDASSGGRETTPLETSLRRQPSNSYGHHRQTSVIHGVSHSRNPSFNSPSTSSPLSPESLLHASSTFRPPVAGRRLQAAAGESISSFGTSPISPFQSHGQNGSLDSAVESSTPSYEHAARPRNAPSRSRKPQGQSISIQQPPEPRTPGEYALHHLFHAFVLRADAKINQCLASMDIVVTPVEQTCGPGADASFDQLISSLGYITRQHPKPLVDSLMLWRKGKGDAAATVKKQLYHHRLQHGSGSLSASVARRNPDPQADGLLTQSPSDSTTPLGADALSHDYAQADRRAVVSVYILCRVLVAIFEHSSMQAITPDLASKLEDIVFSQLRDADPGQLLSSSLRLANWRIFGQVLGHMSRLDFDNVTLRFTRQIDAWQRDVTKSSGTLEARNLESRVELLLLAMRNLHIATSPEAAIVVCEFLTTLGNLFAEAHGPRIKQAYCQLLERLLIPVAACPECFQSNATDWKAFISTVNSRLGNMLAKVRHWSSGFPLSILLLCISPTEAFSSQWMGIVSSLAPKLKDKVTRGSAMQAICQLTWTYLARVNDSPPTRMRRVEEIVRLAFPSGKKTHVSTEPGLSDALVQLIRIIGFAYQDLCFRSIIFPLVQLDAIQSSREHRIESMEPERIVIGIRGFLATIPDSENGNVSRPPFPVFSFMAQPQDGLPTSPISVKPEFFADVSRAPFMASSVPSSSPVNVASLSENTRQYYFQFCEILGKITILCDNAFGGQASLNEKFSSLTPKTPLTNAFSLGQKDDNTSDQRHSYFELLHVAIQALPRCFTDHIPLNTLINLLCTGSAHVEPSIAASAAESLKAIARQGYAQSVAIAFPRFIFNYDMQYSTMSDEGRLGPAHIETTLALYLELLTIWTEQVKQKARGTTPDLRDKAGPSSARAVQMEMTSVVSLVDEIEGHGFFFLCSQSRRVRSYAIRVLRLVIQFDNALGKDEPSRILKVLEKCSPEILDLQEDTLSVAERSRLQKDKHKSTGPNMLVDISSSEVSYDATLWFKAFPNLVRCVFLYCPHAIALCRGLITDRLLLMQSDVEALAKLSSSGSTPHDVRTQSRSVSTPADVLFDQWKLYLIMACVTLSSPGAQSQSQLANAHSRKTSRVAGANQERLGSARALLSAIIPMLAAAPEAIRGAVVVALGSINRKLYRTLLESLQYAVITCNDEAKAHINSHHRTPSSPQRTQMTERLRVEVTHVYKLTAAFLRHADVYEDEWILNNLVTYAKDLRIYLSDTDVHSDWRFQRLRYHYCGLIEEVFEGTRRTGNPSRWMPFEARKSAFALMEDWCGFPDDHSANSKRRDSLEPSHHDPGDRSNANASLEKEKTSLRIAALSSMAALCAGPISIKTDSNAVLAFNLPRMLAWIDMIFATRNDKVHTIGKRALRLLLLNNNDQSIILEHAIECCYRTENTKALESYFDVVAQVLVQDPDYPVEFWRILGTVVFTLGSESREIRMKSAKLLRTLDERRQKSSNLQEFDISISDKTRAVYKLAQFEYSKRLASAHPDLAFMIFSEFSLHYKSARTDHQRNIVAGILPWLQTLELQVDSNTGGPTAVSYMLLANMFEITICSSSAMHNEVQALWQALATGPHAGNVQLILDFIIYLCLERRDQNFVEYAKQIIVYLSTTPAGSRVLEFLLLQLAPKNMVNDKKNAEYLVPDMRHLPYVADLNAVLPTGNKQTGLSLGQVALIFLVDLMVPPIKLPREEAIKLIHAVFILWDHYTPTVQEQAREMLVHLLHELVATKLDGSVLRPVKQQIEEVVDSVRRNDAQISWSYEHHAGKHEEDDSGKRVPVPMAILSRKVVDIFTLAFDNFEDAWAKEALHWASICPVRHLACRSFQVFRCISVILDSRMLADMLARLSNTIADEQSDYQTFSLEILTTLKVIIEALDPKDLLRYPQLFWTTSACLSTIHEREFFETLGMLEKLLEKLNIADPHIAEIMLKAKPSKWEGEFEGIHALLYKGLKSADSLDRTLALLEQIGEAPDGAIIGPKDRLLYNILANLPRMLRELDLESPSAATTSCTQKLAGIAQDQNHDQLYAPLSRVVAERYTTSSELLTDIIEGIKSTYFPAHDAQSLIFMIGLLTNRTSWFRVKVMDILCQLIPHVDMKDSAITSHGPDLISPLLRLLQTEHSTQALQVMDHIMEVSGNPLERHHLRMSMASGPARAIRKEYEHTISLYGIPLASGWSIPMPAMYSSMTRNNVHAVFYTCGDSETIKDTQQKTPEIEFHQDDGYNDSYFPPASRAETMRSMETTSDANVSDLVNTLDSLDDFFDDLDGDAATTPTGTSHSSYVAVDMHDNNTNLYDEQTAPILQRSLARNSSSVSFQNGLFDPSSMSNPHHRGQASVSSNGGYNSVQTSFSSIDELSGPGPSLPNSTKKSIAPPTLSTGLTRPGLHSRSITSPANQFPASHPNPSATLPPLPQVSMDTNSYIDDTVLSDSENSPFPPLSATISNTTRYGAAPPASGYTPTSATESGNTFTTGMRRGVRRLTGGRSESAREKEKAKDAARLRTFSNSQKEGSAASSSPRVPRVPLEYLTASTPIPTQSPATSPGL